MTGPPQCHLDVQGITKRFARVLAVDGLSFGVPRGVVFGLLGPNGAGKTTTIRMVMRITLPDEGQVLLDGAVVDDAIRERIGYLPEERGLYRRMRTLDHLVFLAEVRGLPRGEARRRATAWLDRMGLADKARARVEELSKGMQQKVQFAGAVIHEPELVILDEPFAGLDPIATRQLKDEILQMRERGTTVMLSTHVLPQAEELCDHICLINRGRVILGGALVDIRARHARRELRVVTGAGDEELAKVAGVAAIQLRRGNRVVVLDEGASACDVVRALATSVALESVEPEVDSLETIFLRAVEADHAFG